MAAAAARAAAGVQARDEAYAMPNGYGLGISLLPDPRKGQPASLNLALRGNYAVPGGHNRIGENSMLMLGQVRLPGGTAGFGDLECDQYRREFQVSGKGADGKDSAATLHVSRLSPAVLIELEGETIELFAAAEKRWWAPGEEQILKTIGQPPLPQPRPPLFHAVGGAGGAARVGALREDATSVDVGEGEWLLTWYGAGSWFLVAPMEGERMYGRPVLPESSRVGVEVDPKDWGQPVPGDAPFLFVCSSPCTVELTQDSLRFTFWEPDAKIALLPLEGYRLPPASETKAWSDAGALPESVLRRCEWWAGALAGFPLDLEETLAYDADSDTLTMTQSFNYNLVREGGTRIAPIAPMLEIARRAGFPVSISAPVRDAGMPLYCGPYAAIENADSYTATITGLGKYAREAPNVQALEPGVKAEALRAELESELDKMLAAGHLAPVNLPFKIAWPWTSYHMTSIRHLFSAPGQTLSALAAALPFLGEERQERVREYMMAERTAFPPEQVAHLPSDAGARREPWHVSESFIRNETDILRQHNFHIHNNLVPAQALYDLAAYYSALGPDSMRDEIDADDPAYMDVLIGRTVGPWLGRGEWATLGWFSFPPGQRHPRGGHVWESYGWSQTADVNRMAAAYIGLARLARMMGDHEREAMAMTNLFRVLTHRFAIGKYMGWLYTIDGIMLNPPGFSPEDDPREIVMFEERVILGSDVRGWIGEQNFSDEEGAYQGMVPELARFFGDFLRPEAESFVRAQAAYYPDAFLTLGTPRRITEWWHNYPQDAWQIFMVHARILDANGDWLRRRLDTPLTPVGDLYYIDKLTAALTAFGETTWTPIE